MLRLLRAAADIADINSDPYRKACIGAIAIRRDGVQVSSRNGSSTPIKTTGRTLLAHAERRLLRKSGFGATVYVARMLRDGHLAMAKPCGHCMAALRAQGVEMVYYTISDNLWENCRP